jgi:hypothetical protein
MKACKVEGCGRSIKYRAAQLCQKHYFRVRRNGHTELLTTIKKRETGHSRQYRITMPGKGYQRLYEPTHPLRDSSGYVSEHRKVVYDRYGECLPDCEICGKPTNWATCHIDHIDEDVKNNCQDNLRPLCAGCNTWRNMPPAHTMCGRLAITYDGETKTAYEWSCDQRVNASHATIKRRKLSGMSDYDSLFAEKLTHNGKKPVKPPRKTQFKHQRKNAIRITINGETLTASEWSRHPDCKVSVEGIVYRIKHGWDHVAAVFMPSRQSGGAHA